MSADSAALGTTPSRWADLRPRLVSAAVLVPPMVFAIAMGGAVWIALVVAFGAILVWEWGRLCRSLGARTVGPPIAAIGAVRRPAMAGGVVRSTLAVPWWAAWSWVRRGPSTAVWLPVGVIWLGAAAAALLALRLDAATGFANTIFLCLVVAAADVGAYAFGRTLGGPRLAPRISPNKTWTGAAGGLISAMAVGAAAGYALQPAGLGIPAGAAPIAGALALVAMAGDLFESWVKRRCDVKDSSGLLPGHGGLLDRLDGLLFAAPVAALLAAMAAPDAPLWVMP